MGQAPELLRAVLAPLAGRYDLDYGAEMLDPSSSREARAYRFLQTGAWLLVLFVEPEEFPANTRRGRKRGAKRLAKSFRTGDAGRATLFLTQAMGIYLAETLRQAGEGESAGMQEEMTGLVQSFYPLAEDDRAKLDEARDRLRRLEILTPAASPLPDDADEELRKRRFWAAQDAFRTTTSFEGIRLALGDAEMEKLADDLRYPGSDMSYDALSRSQADARWWTDAAADWSEAAMAALS